MKAKNPSGMGNVFTATVAKIAVHWNEDLDPGTQAKAI